jgi:hypothetical protein
VSSASSSAGSTASTGNIYYVATTGSDSAAGTLAAPWATLNHANAVVAAGDTVYIRSGTYAITAGVNTCASETDTVNAITLSTSGTATGTISYLAYAGESPVFDFSGMTDDCRIKGFNVTASYIHLKGLEIFGVLQGNYLNNESWGVWVNGSNNTFELLNIHDIQGAGFFLKDGGYNLVLNTDSHHNYDPKSKSGAGQNADGFGAHVSANKPGNVFSGCRSWWNTDDGFDLIKSYSSVTIKNSWSWLNGYYPGTTTSISSGNGNGFKAGGYSGAYASDAVPHTVENSVAFKNKVAGFYSNHHPVPVYYYNNTSFANGVDFNLLSIDSSGAAIYLGVLRNNIAYTGTLLATSTAVDATYNSWNLFTTVSDADFQSVSTAGWDAARQSDGSLPVLTALHLTSSSTLIDKGIDVGLSYKGSAPDLGAFEY